MLWTERSALRLQHAALKLGVDGPFRNVPPQFGYWLGTRAKRGFGTQPSTWQNGLQAQR